MMIILIISDNDDSDYLAARAFLFPTRVPSSGLQPFWPSVTSTLYHHHDGDDHNHENGDEDDYDDFQNLPARLFVDEEEYGM